MYTLKCTGTLTSPNGILLDRGLGLVAKGELPIHTSCSTCVDHQLQLVFARSWTFQVILQFSDILWCLICAIPIYNSVLNWPEEPKFVRPFCQKFSQWLMALREQNPAVGLISRSNPLLFQNVCSEGGLHPWAMTVFIDYFILIFKIFYRICISITQCILQNDV